MQEISRDTKRYEDQDFISPVFSSKLRLILKRKEKRCQSRPLLLLSAAESALRFDGKSYLRYLHQMDEDRLDFRLALRFKTLQEHGLLVSADGARDRGSLQVFAPLKRRRCICFWIVGGRCFSSRFFLLVLAGCEAALNQTWSFLCISVLKPGC